MKYEYPTARDLADQKKRREADKRFSLSVVRKQLAAETAELTDAQRRAVTAKAALLAAKTPDAKRAAKRVVENVAETVRLSKARLTTLRKRESELLAT